MTDGLVAALARAQANFPSVPKSRTAKVKMKSGGEYSYTYADLADVLSAVRPVLAAEGIALVQCTDIVDGGVELVTKLLWGDESIEGRYPLHIGGQSPQEVGSLLTYFRRYTATSILGISAQDDDDGQQAQQSHRAPAPRRERPPLWSKTDGWHDDDTPELLTTNAASSKVVVDNPQVTAPRALEGDSYKLAKENPPHAPLSEMTAGEMARYADTIGVKVSGNKGQIFAQLEPYVLAATGEEPWPTGPVDNIPREVVEKEAIPFEPVVAKPHTTATERAHRDQVEADIREGR